MGLMLAALLTAAGRAVTLADRHAERRAQAAALGARGVERLSCHELVFEAVGRPETWTRRSAPRGPAASWCSSGAAPAGPR